MTGEKKYLTPAELNKFLNEDYDFPINTPILSQKITESDNLDIDQFYADDSVRPEGYKLHQLTPGDLVLEKENYHIHLKLKSSHHLKNGYKYVDIVLYEIKAGRILGKSRDEVIVQSLESSENHFRIEQLIDNPEITEKIIELLIKANEESVLRASLSEENNRENLSNADEDVRINGYTAGEIAENADVKYKIWCELKRDNGYTWPEAHEKLIQEIDNHPNPSLTPEALRLSRTFKKADSARRGYEDRHPDL